MAITVIEGTQDESAEGLEQIGTPSQSAAPAVAGGSGVVVEDDPVATEAAAAGDTGGAGSVGVDTGDDAADAGTESDNPAESGAEADDGSGDDSGEPTKHVFDGVEVDVEVPADLREQLTGQGVDVDAVVTELYSGDFTLSEETKGKLSEIYGPAAVESYLSALKTTNQSILQSHASQAEAAEKADGERWTEATEWIGGEAEWQSMEGWMIEHSDDQMLDDFNGVMQSGNKFAQELAIKEMHKRFREASGDDKVIITGAENGNMGMESDILTSEQYQELFISGEYKKDPAKYDKMRRNALDRGL